MSKSDTQLVRELIGDMRLCAAECLKSGPEGKAVYTNPVAIVAMAAELRERRAMVGPMVMPGDVTFLPSRAPDRIESGQIRYEPNDPVRPGGKFPVTSQPSPLSSDKGDDGEDSICSMVFRDD